MTIPGSDTLKPHLLRYMLEANGPVKLSVLIEDMSKRFDLTEEERNLRIDSGRRQFDTRVTTAVMHLKKTGSMETPYRAHWQLTSVGKEEARRVSQAPEEEIQAARQVGGGEFQTTRQADGAGGQATSQAGGEEAHESKNEIDASYDGDDEFFQEVVRLYFAKNEVSPEQLPDVIETLRQSFGRKQPPASAAPPPQPETLLQEPAVPIEESRTDEYLVCLECGQHFRSLKRHLMSYHQLTPEKYRDKWGLSSSYPMVAPNHSRSRSQSAKKAGFGRK